MDPVSAHIESQPRWSAFIRGVRTFFIDNPEDDARFRELIQDLSVRGLRVCSVLAVTTILFYMVINVFVMGRTPTWTEGVDGSVSIADKLVMIIVVATVFGFSFTDFGFKYGRTILGIGVFIASVATVSDDFLNQNTDFTTGWLALFLILAVGTMPFRAIQTLTLGILMWVLYPLILTYGPYLVDVDAIHVERMQRVFMGIMVMLGTGISGTLYANRYRLFRHREDLREAKDRISEQAQRLEELDRLKARFFANLSHEFRTPLTLMLGPVEDALQGHSGPISYRLSQHLIIARRNGVRLKRLIDELLDLSRLEEGRMELDEGNYDIVTFARTLVSSFSSLAETKSIQLSFSSDADRLVMAFDADKIEKVLTNLLSNALKFTPEHGKILVSIKEDDGMVAITTKDTGPGIPSDQIPLVFNRFHQMEGETSDRQVGTGIGLAIVQELTHLHGGTVHLESELGFGSSFMVTLPVRRLSDEQAIAAPHLYDDVDERDTDFEIIDVETEGLSGVSADAPLVLIADDNDDVREYLKGHLETRYRIAEAKNGLEATELLKEELPSLVLSDVMMPGMDGHELCKFIKSDERTSHIPVVLITARATEESRREGLESGADDYLFKPFNASDLMVRVENLIEIRRVLKERFSGEYVIKPTGITVKSAEAEFLERLQTVVEERIGDTNFGVDWLASEVGISTRQLQRRIRASLGLSAAGYIRTLRLQRAGQLLQARTGTVSEIAYAVGFMDANYFSRLFRQTFGVTPSDYGRNTGD